MNRKWISKALLLLCLLFVLVLSGCDFFAGIFDPLIGTWLASVYVGGYPGTDKYVFKADKTFSEVLSANGSSVNYSGTYTHDNGAGTIALTCTSGGSWTDSGTYKISTDRKTVTLTFTGVGGPIDYTRQ